MDACKGCGKDMERVSTHWAGCHEHHPECAAYREGFRAGMRAAAEINERARLKIETNLSRGKGTWPQADYIRDETWHNWLGHEQALRWARADILAEADK